MYGWYFNQAFLFGCKTNNAGERFKKTFLRVSEIGLIELRAASIPGGLTQGTASANVCMTERFAYQTATLFVAPFAQLCVARFVVAAPDPYAKQIGH